MKILITLFIFSIYSNAAFQALWKGYQVSTINELRKIETENVENSLDYFLNSNAWNLKLSAQYDDTFLDALFSFQAQQTIKETKGLSLSKSTYRYGDFSIGVTQTRYDLSNWDSGVGTNSSDEVFETRTNISYTYDFFNQKSLYEEKRIIQNNIVMSSENNAQRDKEYLDFFKTYLDAKLSVFTYQLAKEMKKRAAKRLSVINRRLKDGLSRKVESYQARSSLLKQDQEVFKSQATLKEKLAIIELILKKEVPLQYFDGLKWNYVAFDKWRSQISEKVNFELKSIEERIKLIEIENKKLADERGHSLKLTANYVTNSFNENAGDSFTDATSGPENDSKVIGIEYSIPFGNSYHDSLLTKQKIDKKRAQYKQLDLRDRIEIQKNTLKYNIDKFEKAYQLSKRQVGLTKQIMLEQNKLYLRSQATFDDVIRAEESYINSSIEEKRILHTYESLIIEYAYYLGSLGNIIKGYVD